MRIIDKRRDYYDGVQSCAQDRTLMYVRDEQEVRYERGEWPLPSIPSYLYVPGLCDFHIIGFCGKLYAAIEMHKEFSPSGEQNVFCYTMDEFEKYLEANLKKRDLAVYQGKQKRSRWRWENISGRHGFADFFEMMGKQSHKHGEIFLEKRCPIFTARNSGRWGGSTITWNAMLKPLDFMRIFDPYTAFQEISMFLSNMAVPEKVMPVIPDELKAQSKGFDRWSFRRMPG